MPIAAGTYRSAALERIEESLRLYEGGHFVGAMYLAGVAVECVFRSYLSGSVLETGHDLNQLLRDSRFLTRLPERHREETAASLGVIYSRWHNLHRYRDYNAAKRLLRVRKVDLRARGDTLKESARLTVEHARRIVNRGASQWTGNS